MLTLNFKFMGKHQLPKLVFTTIKGNSYINYFNAYFDCI